MPKIPLPQTLWQSNDKETLPEPLGAELVDVYINKLGSYSKRPGLVQFTDLGVNTPIDGLYYWEDKDLTVAVSGGRIYTILRDGTVTDITSDTLASSVPVLFDTDGTYLAMANSGKIVVTDGTTTTYMEDTDAPTVVYSINYLDTYMLAAVAGSEKWQFSEVGVLWKPADPTRLDWDALDFYNAQTKPDELMTTKVIDRLIYLIGRRTIEVWYSDEVSPFSRADNMFVNFGTPTRESVVEIDGIIYMLDNKLQISRIIGNRREALSPAINTVIEGMSHPTACVSTTIATGGITYYVITFTLDNLTFALDVDSLRWYKWGSWNEGIGDWDRFIGTHAAYVNNWNMTLVGSASDGIIYRIDPKIYQDAGDEIRSMIETAEIIHGSYNKKKSRYIEARMKRGQGPTDTEPKVQIRWSNDNRGWNHFRDLPLGTVNDKSIFKKITSKGRYKSRKYQIVHSDNSQFEFVSLEEDVKVLDRR